MKNSFHHWLNTLQQIANRYDDENTLLKNSLLKKLREISLPDEKGLSAYHDTLLFLCAYPGNASTKQLAELELKRLALQLKKRKVHHHTIAENEGLPFTNIVTRFSPDFLRWLLTHDDVKVEFDSFVNPALSLNEILNISLPAVLKAETTAGLSNEDLLTTLHIKPSQYVAFLLGQLEELNDRPLLKELFIEKMDLYVKLVPRNIKFSRAFNRIPAPELYYHLDLLKHFNWTELINTSLPVVQHPEKREREQLLKSIKNAMALTVREIDPATFLEEETMRVYNLERGLRIAVYSMKPERQLPLETYFGFTFFKNGIPVSYGGVWVFGTLARIGLNIFEPFRGGESGYILCQLIRVFHQALGVSYIEIEPYQFGLDNPGGISSGAFWFYYKFGFRPVDSDLKELAASEHHKIKTRKNYRSTAKTLLRFTESNIALNLGKTVPLDVLDITGKILTVIKKEWQQNYKAAKENAISIFCKNQNIDAHTLTTDQKKVLEEVALWAMAFHIQNKKQGSLMKEMIFTKTKDDYAYQQLLLDFFKI